MITFSVNNLKEMNGLINSFLDYLRGENVSEDTIFNSRLVSCELITNVLLHCNEEAKFCGKLRDGEVEIEVSSPKSTCAKIPDSVPDVFAERGRGLYIIKSISDGNVYVRNGSIVVYLKK